MDRWIMVGRAHQNRQFDSPVAGAKTNDIIAKPCAISCLRTFRVHLLWMSFLISLVASFVFDVLESSLNCFFTLTYIRETKE